MRSSVVEFSADTRESRFRILGKLRLRTFHRDSTSSFYMHKVSHGWPRSGREEFLADKRVTRVRIRGRTALVQFSLRHYRYAPETGLGINVTLGTPF